MSAVGSPTEGLSELIDHFVQPFIPNIPSYIRYTQDFLDKLHVLCPLPAYASVTFGHADTCVRLTHPQAHITIRVYAMVSNHKGSYSYTPVHYYMHVCLASPYSILSSAVFIRPYHMHVQIKPINTCMYIPP